MTISLVTGGSGFIGQHLVDQLLADGERVRVLDIEPPRVRRSGVHYIEGSVTDPTTVKQAMDGVRHLYHTAAIPHLWIPDPKMFEETNVIGTRIVFEEALGAGVERAVHTSSATVLIDGLAGGSPVSLDERYQTQESDLFGDYARSKWRAEAVALEYSRKLPVVIVLPTLPLGPGDQHLTPPSRMLLDFVNGKNSAYADCILNIIDVRDVAAGHRRACASGRPGDRYILNCHSLPMTSFLECLETLTGRAMPSWRIPGACALAVSGIFELWSNLVSASAPIAPLAGTRMGLQPIIFCSSRAKQELELPSTPLAATLSDAVAWLSSEGHLIDERSDEALVLDDR
ncbi:MAG: NAD-dependent epimerase/dehydratase family protein [Pseudomonadota bacterium]